MDKQDLVLKPYRLRTVKVAVQATFMALIALAVYPFLPGDHQILPLPYISVMIAAVIGAATFSLLPWDRLLDHHWGMWVFYAWSFLDILLITLLVAITGGAHSDIYVLYALTTVFLAASYPPKGQAGLILVTFVLYASTVAIVGGEILWSTIFLRMATMGTLGLMGNFLSRELVQQMNAHQAARAESDRRALMMTTVTRAAQVMTLDIQRVLTFIGPMLVRALPGVLRSVLT